MGVSGSMHVHGCICERTNVYIDGCEFMKGPCDRFYSFMWDVILFNIRNAVCTVPNNHKWHQTCNWSRWPNPNISLILLGIDSPLLMRSKLSLKIHISHRDHNQAVYDTFLSNSCNVTSTFSFLLISFSTIHIWENILFSNTSVTITMPFKNLRTLIHLFIHRSEQTSVICQICVSCNYDCPRLRR